jgi:hypothetical protein
MMRLEGAERLVLQVILATQGESMTFVPDAQVAHHTDLTNQLNGFMQPCRKDTYQKGVRVASAGGILAESRRARIVGAASFS